MLVEGSFRQAVINASENGISLILRMFHSTVVDLAKGRRVELCLEIDFRGQCHDLPPLCCCVSRVGPD